MKETINKTQFVSRFDEMNRSNSFSLEGRELLFDWIEELEEAGGYDIDFDPIAICCEFAESDLEELNREYSQEFEDLDDAVNGLEEETLVVGTTNHDTVVYAVF